MKNSILLNNLIELLQKRIKRLFLCFSLNPFDPEEIIRLVPALSFLCLSTAKEVYTLACLRKIKEHLPSIESLDPSKGSLKIRTILLEAGMELDKYFSPFEEIASQQYREIKIVEYSEDYVQMWWKGNTHFFKYLEEE